MRNAMAAGTAAVLCVFSAAAPARAAEAPPAGIFVRDGFTLEVAASGLDRPRFMEMGPDETLYVSFPGAGEIRALRDEDDDGLYEENAVFVSGRSTAHAMQWHEGALWFTQSGAVLRAVDDDGDHAADTVETILDEETLPSGGGHWWRSLLIHQGRLYTSIGNSGNISDESDTKRMKVWSYDLEGGDERRFCGGLRNTEKLVVRPGTDEIWGMDHGSDWFGRELEIRGHEGERDFPQPITDRFPPEEMNHLVEGGYYGHPFVVGARVPRYEYMDRADIVEIAGRTTPPAWEGGAHWAANAMEFYTGALFAETRGDAFVAYHGSWNRSERAGYCVSRVLFDDGRPFGELVYVRFLGPDDAVLARPVDVVMEASGALLVSDDSGGRIYRLRPDTTGTAASFTLTGEDPERRLSDAARRESP